MDKNASASANRNHSIQITSKRFIIRPLRVDDVGQHYADWLKDTAAKQYIAAAASSPGVDDLKQYVEERSDRDDVLFLGIFDKANSQHIGNIKYEPVDSNLGYAIMGILIGKPAWRGKGVAAEVLESTAKWLKQNRNIKQIVLGVDRSNIAAIRSYIKVGFVEEITSYIPNVSHEGVTMVWHLG
jgi:[ribosomal protein S5]-alanine N-acetyltransferase